MARPNWFWKRRKQRRHFRRAIIAKSAIQAFLARPREDFNWIKSVPDDDLRQHVFDQWNAFHTKPRIAQLACFAIGMEHENFLFNLDCGVGKSKAALDLIRYHRMKSRASRWLILMPNLINVQAWEDQIAEHAPDLTYEKLLGTREQRHRLVNERVDVALLNYAGLQSYMTELVDVAGKKKRERKINADMGNEFASLFDGVIFDEIHNIASKEALTYWLCRRLSRAIPLRYGSTATLFGFDPSMAWTQFDLVDHGYTLGETLALYRAAFFEEKEDDWKGTIYTFDHSKEDLLNRFLRHRSLRYTAAECGDVPKVSRIRQRLTWSDEQLLYYNKLREECRIRGVGDVKLNPNTYVRMRQITSGYVGYENDDGKAKLVFDENPKLERLLQIIDEMPLQSKIMVYHQYQFTHTLICEALSRRNIRFAELWGKGKDSAAQYRKFLDDKRCRVMVANYSMVAGGNPHKVANYVYYFESPPDPITRKQSEERVNRPGQPQKVFIYDPEMPKSVDTDILDALKAGQDFYKRVVEGKARV